MKKNKEFLFVPILLISMLLPTFLLLLSVPAAADSLWDMQLGMGTQDDEIGHAFGERGGDRNSVKDIRQLIADIINIFLGFLGIIFLILIIYGGFMWMTAAGQDEKINKARSLLQAGIIGLIIVVASWSIAIYVSSYILAATKQTVAP